MTEEFCPSKFIFTIMTSERRRYHMADITLSASIRANLLSLQNTSKLLNQTSTRLSTGKKVNSAIDDPVAFFKAKGLSDRAGDLATVKDSIGISSSIVKNSVDALDTIEGMVKQLKGLTSAASSSSSATERAAYATQYDALLTEIDNLAADSGFAGVNLLAGTPDTLSTQLNEGGTSFDIVGVATDTTGLGLAVATAAFATNADVDVAIAQIDAALVTIRSTASALGSNAAFLEAREDFTSKLINNLEVGAGKLVNANLEEESANMLALQTRQQLGIQALSFSNQSEQGILRLF